jgi:D-sedoheptulose 7-phosphate isomerase
VKINFYKNYLRKIFLLSNSLNFKFLEKIAKNIYLKSKKNGKVIIVGNGGSAAIASHISIDLNNAARIQAINFNDPSQITCYANDYGYENWVSKAISPIIQKNDTVILISSSGNSMNIINAAKLLKDKNIFLITFSGFNKKNKLVKLGNINLWCNSKNYNHVEATHFLWLLALVDRIILLKKS